MKLFYKILLGIIVLICSLAIWKVAPFLITEMIDKKAIILLYLMLFFTFLCWLGVKLVNWAKQRKAAAVVFGAAVQMLLPDPYAERTIKIVQERKKETRKEQHKDEPK